MKTLTVIIGLIVVLIFSTSTVVVAADNVPLSHVAEPDVYKVLAENDQMRVILATWKPSQRDKFHSHPMLAAYYLTDCSVRIHFPDGTFKDGTRKANTAQINPAVASHSFENTGKTECSMVLVEYK